MTDSSRTGRSLHLTLNITEGSCSSHSILGEDEEVTLNSRLKLPVNITVSHRLSRNGRDYFDHN